VKTLKYFVVVTLALAASHAARAGSSAQAWLENYYLHPQPAALASSIKTLSREGYFEQPGHIPLTIGFLSTIFAKNPELVDDCLLQLNGLPLAHHRLIASALWQAGIPLGSDMLRHLGASSRIRQQVDRLAEVGAEPVLDTPVLSPASMNLHWGAFLASGDERHIVSILVAIGTNQPDLDATARHTLATHAAAHPRVLEICCAQLARQTNAVPGDLKAALREVVKAPSGS
jgi:hypothetical protein